MGAKVRIDQLMVTMGLAPTRAKAQALLLAGDVYANGVRIDKAGTLVSDACALEVRNAACAYVSRGGLKLEGALKHFAIEVQGKRCLDVGASTGGFTDCLLQHGAAEVIAVDVGYGQLAQKLRIDPRVQSLERTNARFLEPSQLGGQVDLCVVDASFIGLGKLAEALSRCVRDEGTLVALIKPQFEAGRAEVSRGRGVIGDPTVRNKAIETALLDVQRAGFRILETCDSVLAGPKGNLEAFAHAVRQ